MSEIESLYELYEDGYGGERSIISSQRDTIKRLRTVLKHLLLSADATWYERGEGHDWREAVDDAREVLR